MKFLTFDEACDAALNPTPEEKARASLADKLAEAARDLTRPRGPQSTNKVARRGDALGAVHWQGPQWAATSYGVQCRDGTYYIAADRLWENDEVHSWVHHMAEKDWVDLEDFAEALRVARQHVSRRRAAATNVRRSRAGAPRRARQPRQKVARTGTDG